MDLGALGAASGRQCWQLDQSRGYGFLSKGLVMTTPDLLVTDRLWAMGARPKDSNSPGESAIPAPSSRSGCLDATLAEGPLVNKGAAGHFRASLKSSLLEMSSLRNSGVDSQDIADSCFYLLTGMFQGLVYINDV